MKITTKDYLRAFTLARDVDTYPHRYAAPLVPSKFVSLSVMIHILYFLPIRDVIACERVCRFMRAAVILSRFWESISTPAVRVKRHVIALFDLFASRSTFAADIHPCSPYIVLGKRSWLEVRSLNRAPGESSVVCRLQITLSAHSRADIVYSAQFIGRHHVAFSAGSTLVILHTPARDVLSMMAYHHDSGPWSIVAHPAAPAVVTAGWDGRVVLTTWDRMEQGHFRRHEAFRFLDAAVVAVAVHPSPALSLLVALSVTTAPGPRGCIRVGASRSLLCVGLLPAGFASRGFRCPASPRSVATICRLDAVPYTRLALAPHVPHVACGFDNARVAPAHIDVWNYRTRTHVVRLRAGGHLLLGYHTSRALQYALMSVGVDGKLRLWAPRSDYTQCSFAARLHGGPTVVAHRCQIAHPKDVRDDARDAPPVSIPNPPDTDRSRRVFVATAAGVELLEMDDVSGDAAAAAAVRLYDDEPRPSQSPTAAAATIDAATDAAVAFRDGARTVARTLTQYTRACGRRLLGDSDDDVPVPPHVAELLDDPMPSFGGLGDPFGDDDGDAADVTVAVRVDSSHAAWDAAAPRGVGVAIDPARGVALSRAAAAATVEAAAAVDVMQLELQAVDAAEAAVAAMPAAGGSAHGGRGSLRAALLAGRAEPRRGPRGERVRRSEFDTLDTDDENDPVAAEVVAYVEAYAPRDDDDEDDDGGGLDTGGTAGRTERRARGARGRAKRRGGATRGGGGDGGSGRATGLVRRAPFGDDEHVDDDDGGDGDGGGGGGGGRRRAPRRGRRGLPDRDTYGDDDDDEYSAYIADGDGLGDHDRSAASGAFGDGSDACYVDACDNLRTLTPQRAKGGAARLRLPAPFAVPAASAADVDGGEGVGDHVLDRMPAEAAASRRWFMIFARESGDLVRAPLLRRAERWIYRVLWISLAVHACLYIAAPSTRLVCRCFGVYRWRLPVAVVYLVVLVALSLTINRVLWTVLRSGAVVSPFGSCWTTLHAVSGRNITTALPFVSLLLHVPWRARIVIVRIVRTVFLVAVLAYLLPAVIWMNEFEVVSLAHPPAPPLWAAPASSDTSPTEYAYVAKQAECAPCASYVPILQVCASAFWTIVVAVGLNVIVAILVHRRSLPLVRGLALSDASRRIGRIMAPLPSCLRAPRWPSLPPPLARLIESLRARIGAITLVSRFGPVVVAYWRLILGRAFGIAPQPDTSPDAAGSRVVQQQQRTRRAPRRREGEEQPVESSPA